METGKRVLVIGLDGATLDIIKPLVKQGKLPNFSRLMKEGAFGPLMSTIPPITPCAWTSFATGKDPSKHGLYDFTLHEGDPQKRRAVNRTFVKAKSLWKILSEAGKASIVIDVPITYPPEKINGYMISRVMSPADKNCTFPKSLYKALSKEKFITTIRDLHEEHKDEKPGKEAVKKRSRKLSRMERKKLIKKKMNEIFSNFIKEADKNLALCRWLMKEREWDFFMMVFMSADQAGHSFWRYQSMVKKIYEKLDEVIGKIFALAGDGVIKFIISDHGFTSIPYFFNINEWFYAKGLLNKKLTIPGTKSMKNLKRLFTEIRKDGSRGKSRKLKGFQYLITIDYRNTKVYQYSTTSYGLRINLKGRDKNGIVGEESYERFRNYLMWELRRIKHPLTGKRIFSKVLKKEDAYSKGSLGTDSAPDIFLLSPEMNTMLQGNFSRRPKIFGKLPKGYGFHHLKGIFFSEGDGIKNLSLNSTKITDLAPTVLHIMNIPVPKDMDGRVLIEIFDKDSDMAKRKVAYQTYSSLEKKENKIYPKKDEEAVKASLAALGYIR